jgi:SAM-dependent methyltransferase
MDTTTQSSIDFYDTLWSATTRVDQHHKCRGRAIENIMRALPVPTDHRRTILELGCGSGIISALLARYGDVTGLDQSRAGVEARERRSRAASRSAFFRTLPSTPRFRRVRPHPGDRALQRREPDEAARERARRGAIGGHLILTTPNRPISERMRFAKGELQPIENWLDTAGLHALLTRTGWRVQQTSYAFNFLPVLASRLPVFREPATSPTTCCACGTSSRACSRAARWATRPWCSRPRRSSPRHSAQMLDSAPRAPCGTFEWTSHLVALA